MHDPQLSAGYADTFFSREHINHNPRHNIFKATPANTPTYKPLHERMNQGLIHITAYMPDMLSVVTYKGAKE